MKDKLKRFLSSINYYHQLINEYKRAIDSSPDHAMAHVNWGVDLALEGQSEDALEKFKKASSIAPKRFEPFLNWGITLARLERFEEALEKFKTASHNAPKAAFPIVLWGAALMELKQYDKAREKYEKAIAIAPNHPEPYGSWSLGLAKAGFYDEALTNIKKSLAIFQNQPQLYFLWGTILAERGQYKEAIEKFKTNLQLNPDNPDAYYFWSVSLRQLGLYKEALQKADQAIRLYKNNRPDIYVHHGEILASQGFYDLAISSYQQALQLNESLSEAYLNWGTALCKQGHYSQGYKQFKKCLDISPEMATAHAWWGSFLVEEKQYESALEHLNIAEKALRNDIGILLNKAIAYFQTRQPEQAAPLLERALKLDKWNVQGQFLLGGYYLSKSNLPLAKKHLGIALSEKPSFEDAALSLAVVYCEEGNIEESIRQIRPLFRKSPKSAKVNFYYGVILYQNTDYKAALEKYKTALTTKPHYREAYIGAVECLIQMEKYSEATAFIDNALQVSCNTNCSSLSYLYGISLIRQFWLLAPSDKEQHQALIQQAVLHLNNALQTTPDHAAARLHLCYTEAILTSLDDLNKRFSTMNTEGFDSYIVGMMYYLWSIGLQHFNQTEQAEEKLKEAQTLGYNMLKQPLSTIAAAH